MTAATGIGNAGRKAVLLWLATFALTSPAVAGDEDISPSAYQIFDPETGYMIPVDPADARQGHEASGDDAQSVDEVASKDKGSRTLWPYPAGFLLAFFLGFLWWRKKSRA